MTRNLLILMVLIVSSAACQVAATKDRSSQLTVKQREVARAEAEELCQRLPEMKTMSFKGETVNDEIYDGLLAAKDASIPCLIGKISDTTRMDDPRKSPHYHDFRVGDAAFFMLLDITDIPLEQMLPDEIKREVKDDGVYAYFEYVKKEENRKFLQARWRAWYDQKYR